jgi:hypothetical protein
MDSAKEHSLLARRGHNSDGNSLPGMRVQVGEPLTLRPGAWRLNNTAHILRGTSNQSVGILLLSVALLAQPGDFLSDAFSQIDRLPVRLLRFA